MSDKITDAEIVADLDSAIARLENSDSGWACVDAMRAARARIAAAPDMLAALQWIETYARVQVERHPEAEDAPGWSRILAAIAKATGA